MSGSIRSIDLPPERDGTDRNARQAGGGDPPQQPPVVVQRAVAVSGPVFEPKYHAESVAQILRALHAQELALSVPLIAWNALPVPPFAFG